MANPDKERGSEEVEKVSCTQTQIWVLKVSIHCEGCKRKVHKIISNIEGVERVDINLKQHKVSVHGNVDPRTVIGKLEKARKHAELWPRKQKLVNKESKRPGSSSQDEVGDSKVENKPVVKGEAKDEAGDGEGKNSKDARNEGGKGSLDGKASGGDEGEMMQKPSVVESMADAAEKGAAAVPGNIQLSADANREKIGDGNGGNRTKNKGQNGKKEMRECDEVRSGDKDAATRSPNLGCPDPNNGHTNQGPPHHRRAQRPEHHTPVPPPEEIPGPKYGYYDYSPPLPLNHGPPAYAVNYHTACPSSSYGASQYYAPQPPINSYHAYMHPRPEEHRPYYDPYYQRPAESYQLFSDENPNACSLM